MQEGPPHVLSVATHHFVKKGDWDVVVIKKGEPTHAEVFSFGRCAALRNLFVRRLRVGEWTAGDETGLTPLLWPCADDLRYMLSPSRECMLGLSMLLRDLTKYGLRKVCRIVGETELWQNLRGVLGFLRGVLGLQST